MSGAQRTEDTQMFELINLLNILGMKSGVRGCFHGGKGPKELLTNRNLSLKLGYKYGKNILYEM